MNEQQSWQRELMRHTDIALKSTLQTTERLARLARTLNASTMYVFIVKNVTKLDAAEVWY
jgi:hypothetical protein